MADVNVPNFAEAVIRGANAAQQQRMNDVAIKTAEQNLESGKIDQARKRAGAILTELGQVAVWASGGNPLRGQVDPQKWQQGLRDMQERGIDTSPYLDRPDLAGVLFARSIETKDILKDIRDERELMLKLQEFEQGLAQQGIENNRADQRLNLDYMKYQSDLTKPTGRQQDYQFAQGQGYPGSFLDYQTTIAQSGRPQNIGTIPQGYRMMYDQAGNVVGLEPIPGGPADTSMQDQARTANQRGMARLQLEEIGRAKEAIAKNPYLTAGVIGNLSRRWAGTPAADVDALLDTIGANISFDRLNQMRQESPTGGALGQVTERELELLRATAGNLSQAQTASQLLENLSRLERQFDLVVNGPRDGSGASPGRGASRGGRSDQPDIRSIPTEQLLEMLNGGQ